MESRSWVVPFGIQWEVSNLKAFKSVATRLPPPTGGIVLQRRNGESAGGHICHHSSDVCRGARGSSVEVSVAPVAPEGEVREPHHQRVPCGLGVLQRGRTGGDRASMMGQAGACESARVRPGRPNQLESARNRQTGGKGGRRLRGGANDVGGGYVSVWFRIPATHTCMGIERCIFRKI